MQRFSEKLGWKMIKNDADLVEDFCNEIGIGKSVLKVWMHNNKHTFGKKENISNNNNNNNGDSHHKATFDTINGGHNEVGNGLHVSTNGSSSSS